MTTESVWRLLREREVLWTKESYFKNFSRPASKLGVYIVSRNINPVISRLVNEFVIRERILNSILHLNLINFHKNIHTNLTGKTGDFSRKLMIFGSHNTNYTSNNHKSLNICLFACLRWCCVCFWGIIKILFWKQISSNKYSERKKEN